jgi:hypothetical protein
MKAVVTTKLLCDAFRYTGIGRNDSTASTGCASNCYPATIPHEPNEWVDVRQSARASLSRSSMAAANRARPSAS